MEINDVLGGELDELELTLATSIREKLCKFFDRNNISIREMRVVIGRDHSVVVDCILRYGDLEIRRAKGET